MTRVDNCIFCGIVAGDAPANIVLDTDDILAFLDIRPVTRGHVLVIPKAHSTDLESLEPSPPVASWRWFESSEVPVRTGSCDSAGARCS